MSSLFIDTAYKFLTVIVEEDGKILASYSEECFKRQSEQLFVVLEKLFKENNLDKDLIDSIYLTKGPGSYTGVRIAMTLAKVLAQTKKLKLYTISTLRLYAGGKANTMVIMDARAKRAYVGIYDKDQCILKDQVLENEKIEAKEYNVLLDGALIGLENVNPDINECFLNTKEYFEEVKDINYLVPMYLKESNEYYR